jgi:hypothetical protein
LLTASHHYHKINCDYTKKTCRQGSGSKHMNRLALCSYLGGITSWRLGEQGPNAVGSCTPRAVTPHQQDLANYEHGMKRCAGNMFQQGMQCAINVIGTSALYKLLWQYWRHGCQCTWRCFWWSCNLLNREYCSTSVIAACHNSFIRCSVTQVDFQVCSSKC